MEKQQAATPRHPGTAGISKRSAQARICDQGRSCVKDRRRMAVIRPESLTAPRADTPQGGVQIF